MELTVRGRSGRICRGGGRCEEVLAISVTIGDLDLQYLGEDGEAGEVGVYLGEAGDICAGDVGESERSNISDSAIN